MANGVSCLLQVSRLCSVILTILDRTSLASLYSGRISAGSSRVFLFLDGSSSVFSFRVLFLKFSTGMMVTHDQQSDSC